MEKPQVERGAGVLETSVTTDEVTSMEILNNCVELANSLILLVLTIHACRGVQRNS